MPGETTNSLFGWLGWARTNDLSVNSRLQLPTVLLTKKLYGEPLSPLPRGRCPEFDIVSIDSCRVLLNISSICGSGRIRTYNAYGAELQSGEHPIVHLIQSFYLSTFPSADVIIICEVKLLINDQFHFIFKSFYFNVFRVTTFWTLVAINQRYWMFVYHICRNDRSCTSLP